MVQIPKISRLYQPTGFSLPAALLFIAIQKSASIHTGPSDSFTAALLPDGSSKLSHAKGPPEKLRRQKTSSAKSSLSQTSEQKHEDFIQQSISELNLQVQNNQEHVAQLYQLMSDLRGREASASLLQEDAKEDSSASILNRVDELEQSMKNSICTRKMSLTGDACKGKQYCLQTVEVAGYNFHVSTSKDMSTTGGSLLVGAGHQVDKCKNCFMAGFQHKGFGDSQTCVGGQQSKCGNAEDLKQKGMVVLGGSHGKSTGEKSTAAGGWKNSVSGQGSTIIGGFENYNNFRYAVVSGSRGSAAKDNSLLITGCGKNYTTVGGTPAPCEQIGSSALSKKQKGGKRGKAMGHINMPFKKNHHDDEDEHEEEDDYVVDDSLVQSCG